MLVRALAIMHNDGTIGATDAVQQSFEWGFTLLRAGVLDRHTFGLSPIPRRQGRRAARLPHEFISN